MTLEEFSRQTGWPREELESMPLSVAEELFDLYDQHVHIAISVDLFLKFCALMGVPEYIEGLD